MPCTPWSESIPPNPVKSGIALVGLVVAVGVFEHEQVGAVAHEDAASLVLAGLVVVLLDGDAHRHGEDAVGEDGRLVGLAVAVGVFEDLDLVGLLDAVKPPIAAASESIVQPLGDPDSPARIDVDIGGIDQQRLGRPQRRLQPRSRLEPPGRLLGLDLGQRGRRTYSGQREYSEHDPGNDHPVRRNAVHHRWRLQEPGRESDASHVVFKPAQRWRISAESSISHGVFRLPFRQLGSFGQISRRIGTPHIRHFF